MVNLCLSNQEAVTLPKPTEVVDTTLRLGPAAQVPMSVVLCNIDSKTEKENHVLTSLKEFFIDLEEICRFH